METVACIVCRKNNWKPVLEGRDFLHGLPGRFTVARCQACGFLSTNPRPDAQEIQAYYPEEYGPYQLNQARVAKHVDFRKCFPLLYRLVEPNIFIVAKQGKSNRALHILEVGCGAGNFLYELKLRFPHWQITGTDFSQTSIERLQKVGINAYVSDLQVLREGDTTQDVVYGFMILEHLHFLEKTLSEVRRILKEDGHLVVAVPNIASWQFRLFGRYAYILHLPAHLYHFTEHSLIAVLTCNGFVHEKTVYHRTLQDSSFSLCYAIRESRLPAVLKRMLLFLFRWRTLYHFLTLPLAYLQAWTKQSAGMTLVFRKAKKTV